MNNQTYCVSHFISLLILTITLLYNVVCIKDSLYDLKVQLDRIESNMENK